MKLLIYLLFIHIYNIHTLLQHFDFEKHKNCFKSLVGEPVFFPMTVHQQWSDPPAIITAEVKFTIKHKYKEYIYETNYYLSLISGMCPEAYQFSMGSHPFDQIHGNIKLYLGYKQFYITEYIFVIYKNASFSVIDIVDVFKFGRLFVNFTSDSSTVIKNGIKAPIPLVQNLLRKSHSDKNHVCLMLNQKKFVLPLKLNSKTRKLPEFSFLLAVVYYGNNPKPFHWETYAAWGCSAPNKLSQTKCEIAIPKGKNPRIIFNIFSKITEKSLKSFSDIYIQNMKGFTLPSAHIRDVVENGELNKETSIYLLHKTIIPYAQCRHGKNKYFITLGQYHTSKGHSITLTDVLKYEYASKDNKYRYQVLVPTTPPSSCSESPYHGWKNVSLVQA